MSWTALYYLLDAFFIAPYRLFEATPDFAFWFGTGALALTCVLFGEVSMGLVYLVNRHYYASLNTKMVRMHNISVSAIKQKDKLSYKAANTWANEYFGKVFFAQASLFAVSLWPAPFALAWLQQRFSGITVTTVPWIGWQLEYPFAFISAYIVLRVGFSRLKPYLPWFAGLTTMHKEDVRQSGELAPWNTSTPNNTPTNSQPEDRHDGHHSPLTTQFPDTSL
ncbi:MAG: hypothetical protein WC124_08645 [Desulfoplanes sp.]